MERLRLALSGAFFGYSTPIRASVYHQVWMAAAQRQASAAAPDYTHVLIEAAAAGASRLHALGATRSLEIVPSNGARDERQGRAVIDRPNLDN